MVINVDELQIGALSVGQKVQLTADAVTDKTYVGTAQRVLRGHVRAVRFLPNHITVFIF